MAGSAYGASFTVNSTADTGDQAPGDGVCFTGVVLVIGDECTLRAAIQEANASGGEVDRITFDIPTTGVATITPATALPPVTRPLTINGYSQDGASVNTATVGTDAVIKVQLDGSLSNSTFDGLTVHARESKVRGLAIYGFRYGVFFDQGTPADAGRTVEGCFIGTDASGTGGPGNRAGVLIDDGEGNVVGGDTPAARNIISGNSSDAIFVSRSANGNTIQGNLIGVGRDGTTVVGQGNFKGVYVLSSNNTIGGAGAASNTIAHNRSNGVQVQGSTPGTAVGNRILENSIYENGSLGIELKADGVPTPNDLGDGDVGDNNLQNYPVISSATTLGATTTISGRLNSGRSANFTIRFYSSPAPDPSGFGEGKKFLGQLRVQTNRKGNASFGFSPASRVPVGSWVTATATGGGDTSEFSAARRVEPPVVEP